MSVVSRYPDALANLADKLFDVRPAGTLKYLDPLELDANKLIRFASSKNAATANQFGWNLNLIAVIYTTPP